jgi:hypothetical protein
MRNCGRGPASRVTARRSASCSSAMQTRSTTTASGRSPRGRWPKTSAQRCSCTRGGAAGRSSSPAARSFPGSWRSPTTRSATPSEPPTVPAAAGQGPAGPPAGRYRRRGSRARRPGEVRTAGAEGSGRAACRGTRRSLAVRLGRAQLPGRSRGSGRAGQHGPLAASQGPPAPEGAHGRGPASGHGAALRGGS